MSAHDQSPIRFYSQIFRAWRRCRCLEKYGKNSLSASLLCQALPRTATATHRRMFAGRLIVLIGMTPGQLRIFIAIVVRGHATRAAVSLGNTHNLTIRHSAYGRFSLRSALIFGVILHGTGRSAREWSTRPPELHRPPRTGKSNRFASSTRADEDAMGWTICLIGIPSFDSAKVASAVSRSTPPVCRRAPSRDGGRRSQAAPSIA